MSSSAPISAVAESEKRFLFEVARTAQHEGRVFMKWEVLNWNQPAIDMYKAMGADFMDEWRSCFLTGANLRKLAGEIS